MDIYKAGNITLDAIRQSDEIKQLLPEGFQEEQKGLNFSLSGTNLVDKSKDDYLFKLNQHLPEAKSSWGLGASYDFEPIIVNGMKIELSLTTNSKFGKNISGQANLNMISDDKKFEMNISTAVDQHGKTFSAISGSYRF